MLRIDKSQTVEGLTVYGDNERAEVFYVLPNGPRLRIDDNGRPVFQFIKYRAPIDRPGGKKAGGIAILDAAFSVDKPKLDAVKAALQSQVNQTWANNGWGAAPPVTIGQITWSKGTVEVHVLDSGGVLVEKVQAPTSPSLYGDNITAITIEFSDLGAPVAEAAFQLGGGTVQVVYNVDFWTALPTIEGFAWFYAEEFYSFAQSIEIDSSIWGETEYRESRAELFRSSQSQGFRLDSGIGISEDLKTQIRSQLQRQHEEMVKRKMLEAIKGVDPSQMDDRGGDDLVVRNFTTDKISSFTMRYTENTATEWEIHPQGTIPNITSLKGPDGNPLKWSDYGATIDADDPFFKTLRIDISAPVAWETSPIDSVDVTIHYGADGAKDKSFHLNKDSTLGKYEQFMDGDGSEWSWHCKVNYENRPDSYVSPVLPSTGDVLTVSEALTGVLVVQVEPGSIQWEKVSSAQVALRYEPDGKPAIEQVVTLTKDAPKGQWAAYLMQPQTNGYKWKVTYTMTDGSTLERDWEADEVSTVLPVNSPFHATRTITIRAAGDLENEIVDITLDLVYKDDPNNYMQNKTVVLDKDTAFTTWAIPVINPSGGLLSYIGSIRRVNGAIDDIPETIAESNTIQVGDIFENVLKVTVDSQLLSWDLVNVVSVQLDYEDPANNVSESTDFLLKKETPTGNFEVELKDETKETYTWTANYFMKDGSQKTAGPNQSSLKNLLIPPPPV